MTPKRYTYFTIFFVVALLLLTSVAWKDYVRENMAALDAISMNGSMS